MSDARRLRDAFGVYLTGVTVVTTMSDDGAPLGFTANSFTSVSLSPPLLLVCPSRHLSSFPVFNACRHFAVNVLAEDQRDLATRFASGVGDRFAGVGWRRCPDTGNPLLDNTAALFSCATHNRVDGGDHLILIGEVTAYAATAAPPLGYANGGYFGMTLERRAAALAHDAPARTAGVIIEHRGRVLMCGGDGGLTLPQVQVARHTGALAALQAHLSAAGVRVDIGSVYAVVEDPRSGAHAVYYRGTAADDDARALGAYEPIDGLADRAAPSLAAMLRRYALERQGGNFGLYIGDAHAGDVHPSPSPALP